MFQVNRDHFSADRYLYANANPVMNWDADGRLTSLKLAMGYSTHGGRHVTTFSTPRPNPSGSKAQWERFKGEYGFKLEAS